VEYEPPQANNKFQKMGSIYSSFLAPSVGMPRKPGAWESFDITLVGRWVTVARNGVKIIDQIEIPGITSGALDSHESAPGPLFLQGDHPGGIRFRNRGPNGNCHRRRSIHNPSNSNCWTTAATGVAAPPGPMSLS
jgi:hypothetical protein